jgi:hypothetical protein
MRHLIWSVIVCLVSSISLAQVSEHSDTGLEFNKSTGLYTFVLFSNVPSNFGLTEQAVRTKCELRLRQTGFKVLDQVQLGERLAYLTVSIEMMEQGMFGITLSFNRPIAFENEDKKYHMIASTWQDFRFGYATIPTTVLDLLNEMMDSYLNEHFKANPKE